MSDLTALRAVAVHLACLIVVTGLASSCSIADANPDGSDATLLSKQDLIYEGAFRVPGDGPDKETFRYGGRALAYNPQNNSLILTGHKQQQRTAEISIPALVRSDDISDLKFATILQNFTDTTAGRRRSVNPQDPNRQTIGGQLVYADKLLVNVYSNYDGRGTQDSSLFVTELNFSSSKSPHGPIRIGRDAHFTSAYMTHIPEEWRDVFGGSVLVGNCCRSIIGFQSHGPAVSVMEPDVAGFPDVIRATTLLRYTSKSPLGPGSTTTNPYYNLTTRVDGIAFPDSTRSILFFGRHGVGRYCYGEAKACNDRAQIYKGTHAYPYVYQVWAYDAEDLLGVKRGKNPSSVKPYDIWTFNLPFERDGIHEIGGVAYDSVKNRLYLSQINADEKFVPVIHAFKIRRQLSGAEVNPEH